jgi:hypothetical protein
MSKTMNPGWQRVIDTFTAKLSKSNDGGLGKSLVLDVRIRVYPDGGVFVSDGNQPSGKQEGGTDFSDFLPGLEQLVANAVVKAQQIQNGEYDTDEGQSIPVR